MHTHNLVSHCKFIRAALGFHPELVAARKAQIEQFKSLVSRTRYIGEVGLDNFYKSPSDYAEQKKVFEQIIQCCDDVGGKILTVHSRRAEKDVISIIGQSFKGKVILHWYSGSTKELERAIHYGFYFSVNYAMLQSPNGRKIINSIPEERILLETDGPYVKMGEKVFSPMMVGELVLRLAKAKGYSQSLFYSRIQSNFSRLLEAK